MVGLAAIFVPAMMLLSWQTSILFPGLLPMLMVDAIALGVVYHLYSLWNKRPIRLRCPACEKVILSNTPWVCGFCKEPNRNANEYPFVHECGHCHDEPKAYRCHHRRHHSPCENLIFLTEDHLEQNYASCLNSPREASEDDKHAEELKQTQRVKQVREEELAVAELDEKLKLVKDRIVGPKVKTPAEAKQELCEREYSGMMGIREYCRKKRAEVAITYKDHPELLKDANDAIDLIERKYC